MALKANVQSEAKMLLNIKGREIWQNRDVCILSFPCDSTMAVTMHIDFSGKKEF